MWLIETSVRENKAHSILSKFKSFEFHGNCGNEFKGRIWVLWKVSELSVQILSSTPQLVLVQVCTVYNLKFLLGVVYGANDRDNRRKLWSDIDSIDSFNLPLLLTGDWNAILGAEE